jgi:acyl dehydratase
VPIDIEKVLGAELDPTTSSWSWRDVALYHLGLGAGAVAPDLPYVYERDLVVLPTFGVTPVNSLLAGLADLPGFDVDHALLLHGEQEVVVPGPMPRECTARHTGRVAQIYDKGSAALVVLETESRDETSGELLCTNRFSLFYRGEGGFGGESGPASGPAAPDGPPDQVVQITTLPQQAALYRLTGDLNPLHVDPAYAQRGGFDRPILHGLSTFGTVAKAVADALPGVGPERVRGIRARFAGVVFPGETLVVETWRDGDRVALRATSQERGTPVLTHAEITLATDPTAA